MSWFDDNQGDWTQNPDGTYGLPAGYVTAPPINPDGTPINTGGSVKMPNSGDPGGASLAGDVIRTQAAGPSNNDHQRVDAMLAKYGSTDNPQYWYDLVDAHGGVDQTGEGWLDDRIMRGDGSALV